MSQTVQVLREGRRREREQAFFYRMLAGDAEAAGDAKTAERLNELLADEQHHVSRLSARLLELSEDLEDDPVRPSVPSLESWDVEARRREDAEVAWYEHAVESVTEESTRRILTEILESERHHRSELAGKWMPAAPSSGEAEE